MKRLVIPLPNIHFDPSEVAIPWKICKNNNIEIIFSTPTGLIPTCDPIMLTGTGLGLLSSILACTSDVVEKYNEMILSIEFQNPISWLELKYDEYDGILLPGGHDKGVKEYLESKILQQLIIQFYNHKKIIAAICHGVVLVGRCIQNNGKSILYGMKTTSLLKQQELTAYRITCLWMGEYYLTYPELTVEDEIKTYLKNDIDFISGLNPGITRDTINNYNSNQINNHIVHDIDHNYLSARWPGDCYLFSHTLVDMLQNSK